MNLVVEELQDQLTSDIMLDPVSTPDGHTYERSALESWKKACKDKGLPFTSPNTRKEYPSDMKFVTNFKLRNIAENLVIQRRQREALAKKRAFERNKLFYLQEPLNLSLQIRSNWERNAERVSAAIYGHDIESLKKYLEILAMI